MAQTSDKSIFEQEELKRRGDAARVRSILEPQDEAARGLARGPARARTQRDGGGGKPETDPFASWLLLASLASASLLATQWLRTNS